MKTLLIALILAPAFSFAAPSGHSICKDAKGDFEFVFGTYALSGDGGTLKTGGESYGITANPGEGDGDVTELAIPFCACEPIRGAKIASVKWDVTKGESSDPSAIKMVITRNGRVTSIDMTCKSQDFKAGNEQD